MKQYIKYITLIAIVLYTQMGYTQISVTNVLTDDERGYIKLASNHLNSKNWGECKKCLENGLKKYPQNSDLKMLLGKYYLEQGKYDLARYELHKSLEHDKNNAEAKQILINTEMQSERYSSAICYINELLELNPYSKDLWAKKMEAYRLQGNKEEANRLLKRLAQIYPEDVEIKNTYLYYIEEEIAALKKEGELNAAIELSTMLVEHSPLNEDFYIELINNCIKTGNYAQALNAAARGVYYLPNSLRIIDKKIDLLAHMQEYDELFAFIKKQVKETEYDQHLNQRNNYFLKELASLSRKKDPYVLYSMLYDRNPNDDEAFNNVYTTALSRALYDDALVAVRTAKKLKGETKDLLLKELEIYKRMNEDAAVNNLNTRLYSLYPNDMDIIYEYCRFQHKLAKDYITDEYYTKAIEPLAFVIENGEKEEQKAAMSSLQNCYYQLNKYNESLGILDRLKQNYPNETEWSAKKALVLGDMEKYHESLNEYQYVIDNIPQAELNTAYIGYDELATSYTKKLIEGYNFNEAMKILEKWLAVNSNSELGIRYAINTSSHLKDNENMIKYCLWGIDKYPNDIYFRIKLADAYNNKKTFKQSVDILSPIISENPYHADLIKSYSESSENYAVQLLDAHEINNGIAVLSNALLYDPANKSLNYWKGIAHEKNKQYDSALYHLALYQPSALEVKPFTRHLHFLKNKTYKNQVAIYYLRSRFSKIDEITSISTVEYIRKELKNSYSATVNYTGRDEGKGIQSQLGWSHQWSPDIYTQIDAAIASKFFSKFSTNASLFKTFNKNWEGEIKAGYRKMRNDDNLFLVVAGVSKELEPWWFNAKFNSIIMNSKWYYSALAQARYYIVDNGYINAMASLGSAPDVDIIDNQLYKAFSVTNAMVGLGGYYMLNDNLTIGVLGNTYNYKYKDEEREYQNLFNIYFQLYVNF